MQALFLAVYSLWFFCCDCWSCYRYLFLYRYFWYFM